MSTLVYITDQQITQLSTTSTAALRCKAIADRVKTGTALNNIKNVDNKIGSYCLTTALWYKRTGDTSYLAPLLTYIRNAPQPPSAVQALNEWRASFGLFATVQLLRRWGLWDDQTTLPQHNNITWETFLLTYDGVRYDQRQVDMGVVNTRWNRMAATSGLLAATYPTAKSASNWGSVARASNLALLALLDDMGVNVAADLATLQAIFRQWLGDTTTGLPNFFSSASYLASWDNWTTGSTNGSQYIAAGIGKYDTANPGLDGVVINVIDRGTTGYNATAAQFGATSSGITYPLENAEYVWCEAAVYLNAGLAARTWGENGNGLRRMGDRFARIAPDGKSQFDAATAIYTVYDGCRAGAARIAGLASTAYGTITNFATNENNMPRSGVHTDWLVESADWAA